MKNISSLHRVAFLALALAGASATAALAQTPATTTPTAPADGTPKAHHDHASVLTEAEKAQLKRAHDQVLATNPDLKTEEDNLTKQHEALKTQGDNVTIADKKALHASFREHMQKMHDAMLKFDPTLAPVFAKLEAAHKDHQHFTKN